MSAQMPPLLQDSGVPFDLFIQALTEQLDKAQAGMAIKARLGKLPLTFAVKEVSLDLRALPGLLALALLGLGLEPERRVLEFVPARFDLARASFSSSRRFRSSFSFSRSRASFRRSSSSSQANSLR